MLSSINFLFLTSLAITSWVILCYFKHIEEHREEQIAAQVNMASPIEEPINTIPCRDDYEIYLNFICIFACIYALAKVTTFAENYVSRRVRTHFGKKNGNNGDNMNTSPIEHHILEGSSIEDHDLFDSLLLKINLLQRENARMAKEIGQLQDYLSTPKNYRSGKVTGAGGSQNVSVGKGKSKGAAGDKGIQPSMFISNRHFHLTPQVYVNQDGNLKTRFQEFNQEGEDNYQQIWEKYLEMRKYVIQKPTAPQTTAPMANHVPIVISTELLQSMQGIHQQRQYQSQHQRQINAQNSPFNCFCVNSATESMRLNQSKNYIHLSWCPL